MTHNHRQEKQGPGMMMRMMNTVMLSCARAAELSSKALDEDLTIGERLRLRMHTAVCRWCRRNRKQLEMIRRLIRTDTTDTDPPLDAGPGLSDDARRSLQEAIERERSP